MADNTIEYMELHTFMEFIEEFSLPIYILSFLYFEKS